MSLKMTPSLPSSRHTLERCPAPRYPSTAGAERAALGGGGELASLLVRVEHLLGDEAKKLLRHPHKMRDELLSQYKALGGQVKQTLIKFG